MILLQSNDPVTRAVNGFRAQAAPCAEEGCTDCGPSPLVAKSLPDTASINPNVFSNLTVPDLSQEVTPSLDSPSLSLPKSEAPKSTPSVPWLELFGNFIRELASAAVTAVVIIGAASLILGTFSFISTLPLITQASVAGLLLIPLGISRLMGIQGGGNT